MNLNELSEIDLSPDIEEIVGIEEILEILQSSMHLNQLSKDLHETSDHSPLLNFKMVPFMSSVSCLFERIGGIESENGQHQKCLIDIVESWGFELIPVPGDGDCCFSALAFSILTQLHNIERRLPGFGTNYDNSSIADVGKRLRRIAVDESCR